MNINLLQNSKQETFPGYIHINAQLIDEEQSGEKTDGNINLNNIEEKTKILKSTINPIPTKKKKNIYYLLNQKSQIAKKIMV